jgi:hypothetical protein
MRLLNSVVLSSVFSRKSCGSSRVSVNGRNYRLVRLVVRSSLGLPSHRVIGWNYQSSCSGFLYSSCVSSLELSSHRLTGWNCQSSCSGFLYSSLGKFSRVIEPPFDRLELYVFVFALVILYLILTCFCFVSRSLT